MKFSDLAECVNDRVDDPKTAGVDRYVGLEHMDSDSLSIRRWGTPDDVESTKLRFKHGDIIFGKRRAYQRKLAVADFEGICSAHAMVLRAKSRAVFPEFLPFFMQSDMFMERAVAISVGSLSPTINWKTLAAEEFVVPPLEEQRRFAEMLSAAEHTYQAARTLANAANGAADAFAAFAFRGENRKMTTVHPRLGTVAQDWQVLSVGELTASSQYGLSTAPQQVGQYPILRMMNLVGGEVVENDLRYIDLSTDTFDAYRLESGDVLFNRTNSIDLVGRTGVYNLEGEHVFASYLVRLRVKDNIVSPEYLTAYLNASLGRQQVLSFATKAVSQANVSASNLAKVLIPVPPKCIQDRIISDLARMQQAQRQAAERAQQATMLKRTVLCTSTVS